MGGSRRRDRLTRLRPDSRVKREWVCTMPPMVGNTVRNRRWVGVSDDGFSAAFNDFTALGADHPPYRQRS